jgi:hypothetical protein
MTVTDWVDQILSAPDRAGNQRDPQAELKLRQAMAQLDRALPYADTRRSLELGVEVMTFAAMAVRSGQLSDRLAERIVDLTCMRLDCTPSDLLNAAGRKSESGIAVVTEEVCYA